MGLRSWREGISNGAINHEVHTQTYQCPQGLGRRWETKLVTQEGRVRLDHLVHQIYQKCQVEKSESKMDNKVITELSW